MTRNEIDKIFDLLGVYRTNDQHLQDKRLRSAWFLTLKPFEAKDVQEAVGAYFRKKQFWPDVTEIALLCPQPKDPETLASEQRFREDVERFDRWYEEYYEGKKC
ncbi:MAG: hypothetical protein RR053_03945 [Evtepia sp.]